MPFTRHFWIHQASRYDRRCRECEARVTMAREVETGRWRCFDLHPVALQTRNAWETCDGVHEQIDGKELHNCGRGGVA